MQSAILNGRLIRDRKNLSLKTPLNSVAIVDSDPSAIEDFEILKNYILEELNCFELKTVSDEEKYVKYKCDPDNKEMGSVLKKKFDKKLKEAIKNLSNAQLKEYLSNGFLMIGDIKIESGWLKVERYFNDEWNNNPDFGCASNMISSVLIETKLDENLK